MHEATISAVDPASRVAPSIYDSAIIIIIIVIINIITFLLLARTFTGRRR